VPLEAWPSIGRACSALLVHAVAHLSTRGGGRRPGGPQAYVVGAALVRQRRAKRKPTKRRL